MEGQETKYYLILDELVGKKEGGRCFLFQEGEWQPDVKNEIMDRLFGYDPSEPPGSPYAMFNTEIMEEITEISYERAMELIG